MTGATPATAPPRPSTREDFELAERASAELADWVHRYLGGTLGAAARNRLKFLVVSAQTGDQAGIRLVSEPGGRVPSVRVELLPDSA